ncbi:MAG: response regulator transcription factor [Bryobacteraceae bacterium]|nr:response regulator transcription factor [Bryobacteraceae bacterium]
MTNSRILLVEDEPGVVLIVTDLLVAHGYSVDSAGDGSSALRKASETSFDLLILDVMLPGVGGLELCHTLRQRGFDGGILMLTAKSQVADRVDGLRTGADDYLIKPFDPGELLARVGALLRRVHKEQLTPVMRFAFGNVTVDFSKSEVRKGDVPVSLAARELQLLRYLIDNRGQVVTRDRLLSQLWKQQPFITPRTVDVHISWLRQKLEDQPQMPKHIVTVRGEGYRFER